MLKKLISECTDYDFKEKVELSKSKSWLKSILIFSPIITIIISLPFMLLSEIFNMIFNSRNKKP